MNRIAPNHALRLKNPLNVASINSSIRELYSNRNTSDIHAPSFSGTIPQTTDNTHVYFFNSDVDVGAPGADTFVDDVCVIYAVGDIRIHGNIKQGAPGTTGSWLGLVSEGTIHLAGDAPEKLTLVGTFVANGGLVADDPTQFEPSRPVRGGGGPGTCQLDITGNIVGLASPNFSLYWPSPSCTRTYSYPAVTPNQNFPSPDLYLPNLSTELDYKITHGRASPLSKGTQLPLGR